MASRSPPQTLSSCSTTIRHATARSHRFLRAAAVLGLCGILSTPAFADGPGRGLTAQFERDYLTFIIDHHTSALRMTELAAGTDAQRDAAINNPQEGTSPTPNTTPTPPKAGIEHIKSIARMANRMQREEIAMAQRFLREWYGINHTPQVRPEGQQQIQLLEQTPAGAQFEQTFLEVFSSHHYAALHPSMDCKVKADLQHHQLQDYCDGIVHAQAREISEMRELLCNQFSICDYQPTTGIRGQRSSNQ